MRISNIVHNSDYPIRHLKRQKKVIAEDYPFFTISLWHCACGCDSYSVTLQKIDLGYVKKLYDIEFNTPLEAFVRFERFVEECEAGKYNMIRPKEGEAFE